MEQKQINFIGRFRAYLNTPIDATPLGVFRILFGSLMVWFCYSHYHPELVKEAYFSSSFHFPFELFNFLHLPELSLSGFYLLIKIMGVSAFFIALGLFYRFSVGIFFLCFGYVFLFDKTYYTDYGYLILLITFLLLFVDAHRYLSIDQMYDKKIKSAVIPKWNLFIIQSQIAIVYLFTLLVKFDYDYYSGLVLQILLNAQKGSTLTISVVSIVLLVFGLLLLMFKAGRLFGVGILFIYQCCVKYYLNIGIYPWLMIAALVLFLDEQQIKSILFKLRLIKNKTSSKELPRSGASQNKSVVLYLIIIYLLLQIALPLRHFVYDGQVKWNKIGDRFSWRMLSQESVGHIDFYITDLETGKTKEVPRLLNISVPGYLIMSFSVDMIIQYAHHLVDEYKKKGITEAVLTANSLASVNGSEFFLFINPTINLASNDLDVSSLLVSDEENKLSRKIYPRQVGNLFSPAYQLAIIDRRGLIQGDDMLVQFMAENLDYISIVYNIPPQMVSHTLLDVKESLQLNYALNFTLEEMFENLRQSFDFESNNFKSEILIDHFSRPYIE